MLWVMARWRRSIADDVRSLRDEEIVSKQGVSVWIPGLVLRSELTCQILVRGHSVEVTTRPRFLGRILGFDWIIPGSSILMAREFRPHELGREHRWIALEPNAYTDGRRLCLQARDMDDLVGLLRGVGGTDALSSGDSAI